MTDLKDPVAVFQAMQRGEIAMLTPMHVRALYQEEIHRLISDAHDDNLARAARLLERSRFCCRMAFLLCFAQLSFITGIWLLS